MNAKLDRAFKKWLGKIAGKWSMPIDEMSVRLAEEEINNRVQNYPSVEKSLRSSPFDLENFVQAAEDCWVVGNRFVATRFSLFTRNSNQAASAIKKLITTFPRDESNAIKRIEEFLTEGINLGFSAPDGFSDWAGAMSLASLILTALYPSRFVDFGKNRWKNLAEEFDYSLPSNDLTRGALILWASNFAREVSETATFKEYWPTTDPRFKNPLWVISGISWIRRSRRPLTKPAIMPEPFNPEAFSFPEGAKKWRLHIVRERKTKLVQKPSLSHLNKTQCFAARYVASASFRGTVSGDVVLLRHTTRFQSHN